MKLKLDPHLHGLSILIDTNSANSEGINLENILWNSADCAFQKAGQGQFQQITGFGTISFVNVLKDLPPLPTVRICSHMVYPLSPFNANVIYGWPIDTRQGQILTFVISIMTSFFFW